MLSLPWMEAAKMQCAARLGKSLRAGHCRVGV